VAVLLKVVIVVAALYFARVVFMPIALAVLLAFLLAPLTIRLRHWGLGRAPSSFLVVILAFLFLSVLGSLMGSQMSDLARKLPEYQQNAQQKLHSIGVSGRGVMNRVTRLTHNVTEELAPAAPPPRTQPAEDRPVPVEIRKTQFSPLEVVQKVLGSVVNAIVTVLIVVVFAIFILIEQEDLRDRIVRLAGTNRVNVATQAMDDAGNRVSRYLRAQFLINAAFGLLAGVGLFFVGVPNPFLWGMTAAILRYVPYLGIWVAAVMPAVLAFAVEPGWVKVPIVFGLYFGIDLLMYNVVEPYLYGSSTGISPFAILVAAVFWTWLWGPVGLLLATPLTVCVVVIGRYVPSLEFLSILLSDEPVLDPKTRFYQRLLAMELEEATEVAEDFLKGKSLEDLEDEVIVPALSLAERDRHHGRLEERREQFILKSTRALVQELAEHAGELAKANSEHATADEAAATAAERPEPGEATVLCIPARDEADEIAAAMLEQLLQNRGVKAHALSCTALAGECIQQIKEGQPGIVCVVVVPPFGYSHARYLCRRLRAEFPNLKIVAAVLTEREAEELKQREPRLTADEIAPSLRQTLTAILSLLPVAREHAQPVQGQPVPAT
jgi:predicted PurR-regulated permease PerM